MNDNDGEVGIPECICDGLMFGEDCDNYCVQDFHCYNTAKCENYTETGPGYCHCRNNFYDPQCNTFFDCTGEQAYSVRIQFFKEDFCSPDTGSCQAVPPMNEMVQCVCDDGYTGESCKDVDYCFDQPCSGNSYCQNFADGYNCTVGT